MSSRLTGSVSPVRRSRWSRAKAGVSSELRSLWQPRIPLYILLGVMLGRVQLGPYLSVVPLAFMVSVRSAGTPWSGAFVTGLAVVAGIWGTAPGAQWIPAALVVGIALVLMWILRIGARQSSPLGAAIVSAGVSAIPMFSSLDNRPLQAVFVSTLAGVLALVFTLALVDLAAEKGHTPSGEAVIPLIVLLAFASMGLQGLSLPGFLTLREGVAAFLVMVYGFHGGAAAGAAAGGVLGLSYFPLPSAVSARMVGSMGLLPESLTVGLVVAGLLGGTFRELRKVGTAVGFLLGLLTYAAVAGTGDLRLIATSALLGTILFWVVPVRWTSGLPGLKLLVPAAPADENQEAVGPSEGAAQVVQGAAGALREISRAFEQVAVVEQLLPATAEEDFGPVVAHVCGSCALHQQCWENEPQKTSSLFGTVLSHIDTTGESPAPTVLENDCIHPSEAIMALRYAHDTARSRREWERKLDEGRSLAGEYVKNLARLLDRLSEEITLPENKNRQRPSSVMRVTSGMAKLPKRGSHVSGDHAVAVPLTGDRYLLALSDGMGVGKSAALESKHCVQLLQQMVGAGFSSEAAVKTVNSVLMLRSPEEAFATVDLAIVDLTTGKAEFIKIGAAPTYIKRGQDVTTIKVPSVPVGILNHVEVDPEYRQLRPGDFIVMISDGVWDACKEREDKDAWIHALLGRETANDPEALAESILATALGSMPDVSDDMTVIVARADSMPGSKAEEPRRTSASKAEEPRRTSDTDWAVGRKAPKNAD